MGLEQLAQEIARSLARNQSRGLVDDFKGLTDVVVHGRVDLLGVAEDVLRASILELKPVRKSWGGWFVNRTHGRRNDNRKERALEKLAERLEKAASEAEAAIIRLRCRAIASDQPFQG